MTSMRALINAKCKQCIYDPASEGNWRQQVQACTVKACPLWEIRAKSASEKSNAQAETASV